MSNLETNFGASPNFGPEITDYIQDIKDRGKGNPGAMQVLSRILKEKGPDVYNKVVPNLGLGYEIWIKFKDECGQNLDTLIERYGK